MGIKDLPFPTDPTWDKEHSNPRAEVLPFGIYSQFTLPVAHFRIMNRDDSERIHPELLLWEPSPRQSDKSSKCYDNNSISLKTKTKRRENECTSLLKLNGFLIGMAKLYHVYTTCEESAGWYASGCSTQARTTTHSDVWVGVVKLATLNRIFLTHRADWCK